MWRDTLQAPQYSSDIAKAWAQIIQERPQIEGFLARTASLTLKEYGRSVVVTPSKIQNAVVDIVAKITGQLFGSDIVEKVKHTLSTVGNIDTSSHGGIISEDTLIQSQIVLAEGIASFGVDTMVSLACGVVPMNNATWPRGFFRLGKRESIFSKSFDRVAVHECKSFTKSDIEKKLSQPGLDSCTAKILHIINNVPGVYDVKTYTDQSQLINFHLWKHAVEASSIKNYIHLPLESVTAELICNSIEKNDALAQLFFCEKDRGLFIESLAGLPGTWTSDRTKGTFLFWHQSGDFRAASLWPEDNKLAGSKAEFAFTPETIVDALRTKQIVPSVFSSLIALLFYGVRPLGGYHQIAYLPEYSVRLKAFSERTHVSDCPVFSAQLNFADMIQLGYGFTFLKDEQSETEIAGLDHFLCNPLTTEELQGFLQKTTVPESLFLNTRRWYNEVVPVAKRELFR